MNIRQKHPDKKNAESIIESAKREMEFTLSLEINEASASTIVRNIYECFRKLGAALLIAQGIEPRDHVEPLKVLMKLDVNGRRPSGAIGNLREMRHNINYSGYIPTIPEVKDAIDIGNALFKPLLAEVKRKIQ